MAAYNTSIKPAPFPKKLIMLQLLLLAVLITLVIIVLGRMRFLSPKDKRTAWWRIGSGIFLALLVFLVITGRMHWIGALIGALLPFMRGAFGLMMSLLPYWLKHKQAQPKTSTPGIQEALDMLGLKGDISKGEITPHAVHEAHRHLIQKIHPDRGGNDYLAAKINQARDLLIKELEKSAQ